jgi:hypothetical protein
MIDRANDFGSCRHPDIRVALRQGEANLFTLRVKNPDMDEAFSFSVNVKDELTTLQGSADLEIPE